MKKELPAAIAKLKANVDQHKEHFKEMIKHFSIFNIIHWLEQLENEDILMPVSEETPPLNMKMIARLASDAIITAYFPDEETQDDETIPG